MVGGGKEDKSIQMCIRDRLCIYCDEEMEKEVMAQLPGLSVSRWNPFFADVNVADVYKRQVMLRKR